MAGRQRAVGHQRTAEQRAHRRQFGSDLVLVDGCCQRRAEIAHTLDEQPKLPRGHRRGHVRAEHLPRQRTTAGFTIIAQRLSDDGHRGFVLAPGPCIEPGWTSLEIAATQFLTSVPATQAGKRG